MPTTVRLKRSTTPGNAPTSLLEGEIAINLVDYRIFAGNSTAVWDALQTSDGNLHLTNAASVLTVGNSSVNVVINSTSITLANSSVEFNIEKPTAAQVSGGDYYLNANGSYAQIVIPEISPIVTNTTGTGAQLVDSFEITTYRCVNYITNVKNNNANGHSMSQLSVLYCNNTSPLYAEFGILESNGSLGSFTANANATHVRVYFAPVPSNTTVQLLRSSIPAG